MMNEKIVDKLVNQWGSREYLGRGRCTIPTYFNSKAIILRILQRMYAKTHRKIWILVNDFPTRTNITYYLTHQNCEENDAEFEHLIRNKDLSIVTENMFNNNNWTFRDYCIIAYNLERYGSNTIKRMLDAKFVFDLSNTPNQIKDLSSIPLLTAITAKDLDNLRLQTPVEESQIGITIGEDSNDYKDLEKLDATINKALLIFEDFDTIDKARVGDSSTGKSSNDICREIAIKNGWSEHLDMNIPINQAIDETYNPNTLAELAFNCYDFIRQRKKLLSDYYGKIDKIKDILKSLEDVDKTIIICKSGDFAQQVADELNRVNGKDFCRAVYPDMPTIDAVDIEGNPVYYKSGVNKGKRKPMGVTTQTKLANSLYVNGRIKCLVLSNSPDKNINGDVHNVIICSPSCMTIEEYMYRMPYLYYSKGKLNLITLFCIGTIEQKNLAKRNLPSTHTIVKNTEESDDKGNFSPKLFVD